MNLATGKREDLVSFHEAMEEGSQGCTLKKTIGLKREVRSPYYNVKEAAEYCRTTPKGVYNRVERRQLNRCPGTRRLFFTEEMLQESMMRQPEKPVHRSRKK